MKKIKTFTVVAEEYDAVGRIELTSIFKFGSNLSSSLSTFRATNTTPDASVSALIVSLHLKIDLEKGKLEILVYIKQDIKTTYRPFKWACETVDCPQK